MCTTAKFAVDWQLWVIRSPRDVQGMSVIPPKAAVNADIFVRPVRARMYGPAVRYKMDLQDNERESCINVSGL